EMESYFTSCFLAAPAQSLDCKRKHPAYPLAMKVVFRSQIGRGRIAREFIFRAYEIKWEMFVAAAALETLACLTFVCHEAVETGAQKRLKARFARVVIGEVLLLEGVREEALGEIFGIFVVGLPLQANVFVDGFPVARENRLERSLPYE